MRRAPRTASWTRQRAAAVSAVLAFMHFDRLASLISMWMSTPRPPPKPAPRHSAVPPGITGQRHCGAGCGRPARRTRSSVCSCSGRSDGSARRAATRSASTRAAMGASSAGSSRRTAASQARRSPSAPAARASSTAAAAAAAPASARAGRRSAPRWRRRRAPLAAMMPAAHACGHRHWRHRPQAPCKAPAMSGYPRLCRRANGAQAGHLVCQCAVDVSCGHA